MSNGPKFGKETGRLYVHVSVCEMLRIFRRILRYEIIFRETPDRFRLGKRLRKRTNLVWGESLSFWLSFAEDYKSNEQKLGERFRFK